MAGRGRPWPRWRQFGADRLVAEVNQGGDMVQGVVRQIDPLVPFREVRATRAKMLRAEPVAALYEQGRVAHVRGLSALEAQMMQDGAHRLAGAGQRPTGWMRWSGR
jgi:phage terminase large subunit-like protein